MDPFFISTGSVAVGELGDKTQLLALILANRLRKPVPIIAGIFVATLVNHLIACSVGEWVEHADHAQYSALGARHLFLGRRRVGADPR